MQCRHCGERIEPTSSDDDVALCPECRLPLDDDFTCDVDSADDLTLIRRLAAGLERKPTGLPFLGESHGYGRQPPAPPAVVSSGIPPALHSLLMQPTPAVESTRGTGLFTSLLVAVGLMAVACGGVMMIWSLADARPDLWKLGLPIALGGLGGLVVGLLCLVEEGAQARRELITKLEECRKRLETLQQLALFSPVGSPHEMAAQYVASQKRSSRAA